MTLYVVGAWIMLQGADLAFPALDIPELAIRYVWLGAILGFPVILIVGWRYDVTLQGVQRTPAMAVEATSIALRKSDYILLFGLSAILVAMVFLLSQKIVASKDLLIPLDGVAELLPFDPPDFSIAVLPFDNLSSDPEQEYFVDGMHDALIAELARISGLTVISRTSTLRYKATTLTVSKIARELNVAGSMMRSEAIRDSRRDLVR